MIFLEEKITTIMDKICPIKVVQFKKNHKPWLSQNTKNLMSERNEATRKARLSGDPSDWKIYRNLRNKVNAELDKDKKKTSI